MNKSKKNKYAYVHKKLKDLHKEFNFTGELLKGSLAESIKKE